MVFPCFVHRAPPLRGVVDEDPQRRAQQRRLVLRGVGGGRQGVGAALDGLVPKGIRKIPGGKSRVISWENMVISTRNIR